MASGRPTSEVCPPDSVSVSPPPLKLRVLVVDDNGDAAETLCSLLEMAGHEACAYDGPTALVAYQALRPHVVFLDLGMAQLDGYQVAKRLRSTPDGDSLVIVALTGFGDREHRESVAEYVDYFILKLKRLDLEDLKTILAVAARRLAGSVST